MLPAVHSASSPSLRFDMNFAARICLLYDDNLLYSYFVTQTATLNDVFLVLDSSPLFVTRPISYIALRLVGSDDNSANIPQTTELYTLNG